MTESGSNGAHARWKKRNPRPGSLQISQKSPKSCILPWYFTKFRHFVLDRHLDDAYWSKSLPSHVHAHTKAVKRTSFGLLVLPLSLAINRCITHDLMKIERVGDNINDTTTVHEEREQANKVGWIQLWFRERPSFGLTKNGCLCWKNVVTSFKTSSRTSKNIYFQKI